MTTFEIIRDLILLGLGLVGAGLSIFNYRQANKRDERLVRVTMGTAIPTFQNDTVGRPYAKIEATNAGHRPVTLSNIYIEIPDGGRMFPTDDFGFSGVPDTALPATLRDGDTAHRHYAYVDLAQALQQSGRSGEVVLTPVAEDTTGGIHRGKPWTVSAEQLMRVGAPIKSV